MENYISLRNYLAAQCMPEAVGLHWSEHTLKTVDENAYAMADAMLEVRKIKTQ